MVKALVFYFFSTMFVGGEPVWQVRHSFASQYDCFTALQFYKEDPSGMVITGNCRGEEV